MFTHPIDDGLTLVLLHHGLAPAYLDLLNRNRDHLARWLTWPDRMRSVDDFRDFIRRMLHLHADGTALPCALFADGDLVGNITLHRIDTERRKGEIGYWIDAGHQGRGIVTRACRALIDLGFEHYDLDKIEIEAAEGNRASRAVCERLGMRLEGVLSNAERLNGELIAHAVYGLHRAGSGAR